MAGEVQIFLSPALLTEYIEVMKRPTFRFTPKSVNRLLKELEAAAVMVYPTMRETAALDEPDNRILECALEANAKYVITGNTRHFPFSQFKGIKILTPREQLAKPGARSMVGKAAASASRRVAKMPHAPRRPSEARRRARGGLPQVTPSPALFRSMARLLEAQQLSLVSGPAESYKTWKQGSKR